MLLAVAMARRGTRAAEQVLLLAAVAPRRHADGHDQRSARAAGFDLDRAQAIEHATRHDLAARPVGAGQHDQQLAVAGPADAVEAPQLVAQRARRVVECLLAQLLAVFTGEDVDVLDPDQQAAELGAVALGAADLLLEARIERRRRQTVKPLAGRTRRARI